MKTFFSIILVTFLLAGCDMFGGSSNSNSTSVTKPPVTAQVEWGNMIRIADTYELSPSPAGTGDFLALGQVGATSEAMCVVLWNTATQAFAACRSLALDGQWPTTCTTDPTSYLVTCPTIDTVGTFYMKAYGGTRTLSPAEAELADEIRRKTYCSAPRLDGSSSPCTIS